MQNDTSNKSQKRNLTTNDAGISLLLNAPVEFLLIGGGPNANVKGTLKKGVKLYIQEVSSSEALTIQSDAFPGEEGVIQIALQGSKELEFTICKP